MKKTVERQSSLFVLQKLAIDADSDELWITLRCSRSGRLDRCDSEREDA